MSFLHKAYKRVFLLQKISISITNGKKTGIVIKLENLTLLQKKGKICLPNFHYDKYEI